MKLLLVDLPSILHPIWHMSGKEPDPDYTYRQTVARVHQLAQGFDHVAVCCDSPKSVRKELCPDYKANRPERDERLIHQLKMATAQLKSDGLPVWSVDGYEADDCIASAVDWAGTLQDGHGMPPDVTIVSGDKDLLQLISEQVTMLTPSGKTYGPKETAEKFVPPHQMRDYLILVGDSSDNIKGVPGIGDVKAKALLAECGSIVGIYERIQSGKCTDKPFTPSIVTALKESLHLCEMGRKLVRLYDELEIPFDEILQPRKGETMATDDNQATEDQARAMLGEQLKSAVEAHGLSETKTNVVQMQAEEKWSPAPSAMVVAPASWTNELEPRSLGDAVKLAKFLFDSRMFSAYGTPQAVLSTILAGREFGIGAMASLRGIHNVEGKHALSAGLMAGLILRSGKAKQFSCIKRSNESATVRAWRVGEDEPIDITYTLEDARRAKLIKPNGNWEKVPADMCVARATAIAGRLKFQDVLFALYTPGELGRDDLEDTEAA